MTNAIWKIIHQNDIQQLRSVLGSLKSKELKAFLNSSDSNGNTPLLHAVLVDDMGLMELLLEYCKNYNVNAQDYESGYTAMHKCLLKGNLKMALLILSKTDVDYRVEDNEGLDCLEMLNHSIKFPKHPEQNKTEAMETPEQRPEMIEKATCPSSAKSIWTWGSNNNYLLGHGGSDSRSIPEQIRLEKRGVNSIAFCDLIDQDKQIQDVVMSKYHVVVLSDSKVYAYGFGTGGRLGLGTEDTVFKPTLVTAVHSVKLIAAGPDHSLAVTIDGKLFSWGSNAQSLLGYVSDIPAQLVPREVIRKYDIEGVAASKYHSAFFTASGSVYTWGTNNGQLGYTQAVQIQPRKITSFPQQKILELAVTNFSTIVLIDSFSVFVFAGGSCQKIQFAQSPPTMGWRWRIKPDHPVRIKSGSHEAACVFSNGDVFMFCPEPNSSSISKFSNTPQLVWKHRKPREKAQDCAIGVDGALLIQTESGHVFSGTRKGQDKTSNFVVKYKFQKVPNLEHITRVVGSSSGSFGAIRSDYRFAHSYNIQKTLADDLKTGFDQSRNDFDFEFLLDSNQVVCGHQCILAKRSPFIKSILQNEGSRTDQEYQISIANRKAVLYLPKLHRTSLMMVLEFIYTGSFTKPWPDFNYYVLNKTQPLQLKIQSDFRKVIKLFMLDDTEMLQSSYSDELNHLSLEDMNADYCNVYVNLQDATMKCHSVILSQRSPYFGAILGKSSSPWSIEKHKDGSSIVRLDHIDRTVFEAILRWMESDSIDYMFRLKQLMSKNEWIDLLKRVLVTADELLLPQIVEICSAILARMMNLNNVLDLLELACIFGATKLKDSCLDFVIRNLESFLRSKSLLKLDNFLIMAIQEKLVQLQCEKLPLMLGKDGFYAKLREKCSSQSQLPPSMPNRCISTSSDFSNLPRSNSGLKSPSIRRVYSISPLLSPLNMDMAFSPAGSGSYSSLSKSFEEFSLNPKSESTSWTDAKSRRRSIKPEVSSYSPLPPPTPPNKVCTVVGQSPRQTCMLSNSLETPGVFNRPPNATSSFKSPVSTFTASQSPILNHVSETPKIISMEEQKRNKSINDGLLELRMAPKLSQKQRKKLVASERSGVVEQTPQVAVKKAGSPWGSTSKSKSFIDFGSIQSEQKQKAVVETSIPESPSKWKREIVKKSSSSFLTIQLEQAKDKSYIQKERSKPLVRIQKEESAMEALDAFYQGTLGIGTGEWITIKRAINLI